VSINHSKKPKKKALNRQADKATKNKERRKARIMEELAGRVFVASCESGDLTAVKEAIEAEIPVNCTGRDDSTGLMRAIAMRHQQVVDELVRHPDIDINKAGMGNDITPLHVACISDNVAVI